MTRHHPPELHRDIPRHLNGCVLHFPPCVGGAKCPPKTTNSVLPSKMFGDATETSHGFLYARLTPARALGRATDLTCFVTSKIFQNLFRFMRQLGCRTFAPPFLVLSMIEVPDRHIEIYGDLRKILSKCRRLHWIATVRTGRSSIVLQDCLAPRWH